MGKKHGLTRSGRGAYHRQALLLLVHLLHDCTACTACSIEPASLHMITAARRNFWFAFTYYYGFPSGSGGYAFVRA